MEAIQASIKKHQQKIAKLMNEVAKEKETLQKKIYEQGKIVRRKYLTSPVVLTSLHQHGGMTPRNFARLAVALGKKVHTPNPVTGFAKTLKAAENANILKMQQKYRAWYNNLSPNQKRQMAVNLHKVVEPNNWKRQAYKNTNTFYPALLRNTNLTISGSGNRFYKLSHKVLHNLNRNSVKTVLNRYGNPVPLKTLKEMILKRNGLTTTWKPGEYNNYNRYREYRTLTKNNNKKYTYNKFY
jgi:hypothetical protein